MRANPGGEIPPADVLGRDDLIRRLWQVLERQSVLLTAERRLGKSSVLRKMHAEPQPGFLTVYRDLEGLRSLTGFVEAVVHDTEHLAGRRRQLTERLRGLVASLGGAQVAGVRLPQLTREDSRRLLHSLAEHLQALHAERVVLFWDEVPYMLARIRDHQGADAALALLDMLRELRQSFPRLRMVFTGSIGLHHVLDQLQPGVASALAPVNDMLRIELPPLTDDSARTLAAELLAGEHLDVEDVPAVARAVAEAVDGIPYFVHHVVDQLAQRPGPHGVDAVDGLVDRCVDDPGDPWNLRHYRERLGPYYDEREPLALALLDALAWAPAGMSADELANAARGAGVQPAAGEVHDVLADLARDHYLTRDADGVHAMAFGLVARWWRRHRPAPAP